MWNKNWRDTVWSQLDREFDLIIIGGGITGAGILREARRAGLKAVLFEQGDFASGTSSRSSKLVHGGLRYLKNAQIKLTWESVHEREHLLKEGRGLITPLPFVMANFRGDSTPGWVFGPAWTILYILMGLSLYLIVKDGLRTAPVRQAVILFAAQLLLNFAWSWIFFGRHAILLGLIDVLLLFVLVAATIWVFLRISRPAAWLLVPYLCWVGFASLLNAMIWLLN